MAEKPTKKIGGGELWKTLHPNIVDPRAGVPTTVGSALNDPRAFPGEPMTGLNKDKGDLGWSGLPPVKNNKLPVK